VSEVLARLGFDDFVIRLNHRRALTALLECAGVPEDKHADALTAVDKLDKIGVEGVEKEFSARGIDPAAAKKCLDFFAGVSREDPARHGALERMREFVKGHHAGPTAVDELSEVVRLSDGTPAHGRIRVDPSLARGLSYYTGAIMEIAVSDLPGSLGGGGRYDNLIGMFLGRDIPACGFSLGLERVLVVMTERGMFPAKVSRGPVDVMVAFLGDDLRAEALTLAAEIRAEKVRVDVYPEASRKIEKPLKYASGRNVPLLVLIGEDERARGEVAVRDLQTRQQENTPRAGAAEWIARRLRLAE